MKKTLFILTILFSSLGSYAQNWEWLRGANNVGNENGESLGLHVATDANGNVYAAGTCVRNGHIGPYQFLGNNNLPKIAIVKYDSSGNILWAKYSVGEWTAAPDGLGTDLFGNVFIVGEYRSSLFTLGSYSINKSRGVDTPNYFMAKLDSDGNTIWLKNIGNVCPSYHGTFFSNCLTTDKCGNVFISVMFNQSCSINNLSFTNMGYDDLLVAKFDSSGNIMWGRSFGGDDVEWPASIALSGAGNLYIGGQSSSDTLSIGNDVLTDTLNNWKMFVAKLDTATGSPFWARTNGGYTSCLGYGLAADQMDNVFVSGVYSSLPGIPQPVTFGSISLPGTADGYGFLAKYDSGGNELWAKCTRGKSVLHKQVTVDRCNNVWVFGANILETGGVVKDTVDGNIITAPSENVAPCFVAGWDNSGNYLNASILAAGARNNAGALTSDNYGNVFITGVSMIDTLYVANDSLYSPNGYTAFMNHPYNMFVAKYNTGFSCPYSPGAPCWPASTNNIPANTEDITIYPNPAYDELIIETSLTNYNTTLINTIGQVVYKKRSCNGKQIVNVSNLPTGIYYLKIESKTKETLTRKVVVQH